MTNGDNHAVCRFAVQREVPLPNEQQRADILRVILRRHMHEVGPNSVDPELIEVRPWLLLSCMQKLSVLTLDRSKLSRTVLAS